MSWLFQLQRLRGREMRFGDAVGDARGRRDFLLEVAF